MHVCFAGPKVVPLVAGKDAMHCSVNSCDKFFDALPALMSHVWSNHRLQGNWSLTCPLCVRVFQSAGGFSRHCRLRHSEQVRQGRSLRPLQARAGAQADADAQYDDDADEDVGEGEELQPVRAIAPVRAMELYNTVIRELQRDAVKLRLSLQHRLDMPESVAERAFQESLTFAASAVESICGAALTRLDELQMVDMNLVTILKAEDLQFVFRATKGQLEDELVRISGIVVDEHDILTLAGKRDLQVPIRPKL